MELPASVNGYLRTETGALAKAPESPATREAEINLAGKMLTEGAVLWDTL